MVLRPMRTCFINNLLQIISKRRNTNTSYIPWFFYGDVDLKVFDDLFWIYVDHVFIRASCPFQQLLIGQIEDDFFLSTNVYINRETVSLPWSTILPLQCKLNADKYFSQWKKTLNMHWIHRNIDPLFFKIKNCLFIMSIACHFVILHTRTMQRLNKRCERFQI